jgi:hypothetical protein
MVTMANVLAKVRFPRVVRFGFAAALGVLLACSSAAADEPSGKLSFLVAGDILGYVGPAPAGKVYFDGACQSMVETGGGAFLISPGDIAPPGPIRGAIDQYLGSNFVWYPVLGNHELDKPANLAWLQQWAARGIPHRVRPGPPGAENTMYSFDWGNSHCVVLNEYYDGRPVPVRKDDVTEATLNWLADDLAASRKGFMWVFGHKPIESLPDMDSGRLRHGKESVSTIPEHLEAFLSLLRKYKVRAYICGHTHDCSVARIKGIWQLDSGHARGGGDTGAPSTYLRVSGEATRAWADVYRADPTGHNYRLRQTVELD